MSGGYRASFVCPRCHVSLLESDVEYHCTCCEITYPILFGIPDFRLRADPYLSINAERQKAARLHAYGKQNDFRSLIAFYYSITDDVSENNSIAFTEYVFNATERAEAQLQWLAPNGGETLLDVGCGSGGALIASKPIFASRVGVDIALRWLVIAQKRLSELGQSAQLVCADAEALPFETATFSHVLASDLLENTRSPGRALSSIARTTKTHGRVYVSASNKWWIGPHPASGLWAAGILPKPCRSSLLVKKHGIDILRAITFVSPTSVRRMAKEAELRHVTTGPLTPNSLHFANRSATFRVAAHIYAALSKIPLARAALSALGPVFQTLFVKEEPK